MFVGPVWNLVNGSESELETLSGMTPEKITLWKHDLSSETENVY